MEKNVCVLRRRFFTPHLRYLPLPTATLHCTYKPNKNIRCNKKSISEIKVSCTSIGHSRGEKTKQNIECGELDLGPPRSVGDRCTVAGRAAPADHGIPVDSPTSQPGPAGYSRVQRGWGLFGEERSQENHHTFEYGT